MAAYEGVDGPVVAHPYGGIPATEAVAGLPGLRHLICVAAFVPDVGESMYAMLGAPEPDAEEGMWDHALPVAGS